MSGLSSYSLVPGKEARTIQAQIRPPTRVRPRATWLYLRVPDRKAPLSVRLDQQEIEFDAVNERVWLPADKEPIELTITY